MELKCINPDGEIVIERKIIHVELLFLKNYKKFHSELNPTSYFFKKMLRLPKKQDSL